MVNLGNRLRLAREKKRYTQIQASEQLNIGNKTLSDYERGVSEPDIETLTKLAELYEVSLQFLIYGTSSKNKEENNQNKIADDFQFALFDKTKDINDPEIKDDILKMIEIVKKRGK